MSGRDPVPEGEADFVSEVLRGLERRREGGARYAIEKEVARGGQGAVLRVWDEDLRRSLAMKVILDQHGEAWRGTKSVLVRRTLRRFLEEAQVTGRLDHPGIVPVHELGLDSRGRVYFTMKLVEGQDLKQVFELSRTGREGWTQPRVLGVLLRVCEAMAYAHSKGVLHRDLKPANVMVGRFGEVYVMDWGLAHVLGTPDERDLRVRAPGTPEARGERAGNGRDWSDDPLLVTMDGEVLGTPCYMSPEQARGELAAMGPHSDVYAAGALLYHLVAGHPPYVEPGKRPENHQILRRLVLQAPAPLHERAPRAPHELIAICEKAMAREPAERYADMLALAEDLRAFLENRVVHAYETGAVAELRKWVRRNRGPATAIAGAVLVALGGLGIATLEQARRAEEARRVLSLSAFRDLDDLRQRANELWPAHPSNVAAYHEWLEDAERVIRGLEPDPKSGYPGHLGQIEELRERALPRTSEASEWRFADGGDRWWHEQLENLVRGIQALANPHEGLIDGMSSDFGWGIRFRRENALAIEERSISGVDQSRRWREALAAIAVHPAYGGLDLRPQLGLVPLGPDPDSHLWEFWHVETGEEPRRDGQGRIVPHAAMGLVFVLLPGGTFRMGAQQEDPFAPNFDPDAREDEGPVRVVTVPAFFLSKYEMTQGQWRRFTGSNPSSAYPGYNEPDELPANLPFRLTNPVENVTWTLCDQVLHRLALELPSEARWEYAARGGTSTPWWTGDDPELLARAANLADATADERTRSWMCDPWSDGHVFHAPVGSYRANPFGLHDVLGNAYEWVRDGYIPGGYDLTAPVLDPFVDPSTAPERVGRGGDYRGKAVLARSAERGGAAPSYRSPQMGLRPARSIER